MASPSSSNRPKAGRSSIAPAAPMHTAPTLLPHGKHRGKPGMVLNRPFTLAGARNRAHLHLVSSTVSKCHAAIVHDNGRVYVRDLCSRTHVYVNGRVIHEMELSDGDLLQIGSFTFKLQHPEPVSDVPTPNPGQLTESNNGGGMLPLEGRVTVIGRRPGCDLYIDDESVSTVHAVIFELDGQRYVRDLGSRTGTFVNGVAAHQQPLNFNDRLRVGPREYIYRQADAGAGTFDDMEELEDLVGTARLGHDELLGFTGDRKTVAEPGVPADEGISTVEEGTADVGMTTSGEAVGGDDLIPLATDDDWMPQDAVPAEPQAEAPVDEPIDLDADNGVTAEPDDTVGMPSFRAPTAPPTISPMVEDLSADALSAGSYPGEETTGEEASVDAGESYETASTEEPIADDFFAELSPTQTVGESAEAEVASAEGETTEPIAEPAELPEPLEAEQDVAPQSDWSDEFSGGTLGMAAAPDEEPPATSPEPTAEQADLPEMDDLGMSAHVIGVMPAQWARGPEATPLAVGPNDADAMDTASEPESPESIELPEAAADDASPAEPVPSTGWTEDLGGQDLPLEGESTIAEEGSQSATDLAGFEDAEAPAEELPVVAAETDAVASDADIADVGEIQPGDIDPGLTEEELVGEDSVSAADIDIDELMADEPADAGVAPAESMSVDETTSADAEAVGIDSDVEPTADVSPEQTNTGLDFIDEPASAAAAPTAEVAPGQTDTGLDFIDESASAAPAPTATSGGPETPTTAGGESGPSTAGVGVAIGAGAGAAALAASAAAAPPAQATPPPKRSLWSRLFGRKPVEAPSAPPPEPSASVVGGATGAAVIAGSVQPTDDVASADDFGGEDANAEAPPPLPEDSSYDLGQGEGQGWPPHSGTAVAIGGLAGGTAENEPDNRSAEVDTTAEATVDTEPTPQDELAADEQSAAANVPEFDGETTPGGLASEPPTAQDEPTAQHEPTAEQASAAELAPGDASESDYTTTAADDHPGTQPSVEEAPVAEPAGEAPAEDGQSRRPNIGVAEISLSARPGHGSQIVLSGMGPVDQLWGIGSGQPFDLPSVDELPPEQPSAEEQSADNVGEEGEAAFASLPTTESLTSTPMSEAWPNEATVSTESFEPPVDASTEEPAGTADVPDSFFQELAEDAASADAETVAQETTTADVPEADVPQDWASEPEATPQPLSEQPADATADANGPSEDLQQGEAPAAVESPQPQADPFTMMGRDQGFHFGGMPLPLGSLAPQAAQPARPRLPFADRPVTMDTRAEVLAEVSMVEPDSMPMFGASLPPGVRDDSRLTPMRSDLMPLDDENDLDFRPLNSTPAPSTAVPQEIPLPAGGALANASGELPAAYGTDPHDASGEPPAVGGELPAASDSTAASPDLPPEFGQSTMTGESSDDEFADLLDELELPQEQPESVESAQEDTWSTTDELETEEAHEAAIAEGYQPEDGRIIPDDADPLERHEEEASLEMPLEEPPAEEATEPAEDSLHETLSHLTPDDAGVDEAVAAEAGADEAWATGPVAEEAGVEAPLAEIPPTDDATETQSDGLAEELVAEPEPSEAEAAVDLPSTSADDGLEFELENLSGESDVQTPPDAVFEQGSVETPSDEESVGVAAPSDDVSEDALPAEVLEPAADEAPVSDAEATAAAEDLFEPAADVDASETGPESDESASAEAPAADFGTAESDIDSDSHVSHGELVHDDSHRDAEPAFDGEHVPSSSFSMLPGPSAEGESTVAADDVATPTDVTPTFDLESAAEEMPSADWFDLPEVPVSEEPPAEQPATVQDVEPEASAPATPEESPVLESTAAADTSVPAAAAGAVVAGAAAAAGAAGAAKKPLAGIKPGMVARRPGASPLAGAKSPSRAAPGAGAPLARKLEKPTGPRRVISAKPATTALSTGFRPPVIPPSSATTPSGQPTARSLPSAKPLGGPGATGGNRRVSGAPMSPVRDPFTNTGDMTAPAIVAAAPSRRRLVYILLAVVLTIGAIVAVWLMMQPPASVQGRLQYRGLDNTARISAEMRQAFQKQQIATLTDRQVLEEARREVLDDGMSLGFLDDSRDETVRLTRALSDAEWVDRNLVISYEGATGEADRKRMLALLRAVKKRFDESPKASLGDESSLREARSRIGQINVELSRNKSLREEAEKLVAQGPDRAAEADALRKKADDLKAEFEGVPQKIRAIEKEIAALENLPKTGVAADDQDPELKRMTEQLKSLNDSLSAAVEAATNSAGAPKEMLDAAQHKFDMQVAAARDAAAGNIVLSGYLDKLSALQAELRRHNEELEQQQKDQRQMLEQLRSRLAQETAARIKRAWDADPELQKLTNRRAVVERQYNVASASKLPEAQKLAAEMGELDKQIEAHRELIQAKDEYDPLTKQFLTFIDDSVKLVEQSRKRNEKRLKDLFEAFVAAKPDMDKMPAEQQARAKALDDAFNDLSSARAQYQAALDETNVRADLRVTELTQQVAAQQAKVDARKRELSQARALAVGEEPPPNLEMAEPERLAAIEQKRADLNAAKESEKVLQNEWAQTTLAASRARAEADQAESARLNIDRLDAERINLTDELHKVNQQVAAATGDPLAAVTITEIEPEAAALVQGEDKRMTYSFLASAGGLFLVLMALAASRTPGIYIPPMSQQPPYAQLYDEPEVAGVGVDGDAFSMQDRRSA